MDAAPSQIWGLAEYREGGLGLSGIGLGLQIPLHRRPSLPLGNLGPRRVLGDLDRDFLRFGTVPLGKNQTSARLQDGAFGRASLAAGLDHFCLCGVHDPRTLGSAAQGIERVLASLDYPAI